MTIHPFYIFCISTRLSLIVMIYLLFQNKKKKYINIINLITLLMGLGFLKKFITGSNNETQFAKVFWHNTRLFHAITYLSASFLLYKKKLDLVLIILITDLLFSISYRLINKL